MSNWKAPGPDGVHDFWFKKLTNLHGRITNYVQDCVVTVKVTAWLTLGKTVVIMKDPLKGSVASNYRPIACLSLMWKLLTGIFAENI